MLGGARQLLGAGGDLLGGGARLDLIELPAKLRERHLQRVLLVLQRLRRVEQRRVVADRQLVALGLGPPLDADEQAEKHSRQEQDQGVRQAGALG